MQIHTITAERREEWESFLEKNAPESLLQSYQWGEFKWLMGKKVYRYVLTREQKIEGIAQIVVEDKPLGVKQAILSRGPILQNNEDLPEFINNLRHLMRIKGMHHFVWEPYGSEEEFDYSGEFFFEHPSVQPHRTLILDMNQDLEEILKQCKQKTRYNIRLAEKKEVQVERFQDENGLQKFFDLYESTNQRQNIGGYSFQYFESLFQSFSQKKEIFFLIATHDKNDLAGVLLLKTSNTLIYLFGGSSSLKRKLMAPYLLHFKAFELAKELGVHFYDFWGISKPEDANFEKWKGITRFKTGFGGEVRSYPETRQVTIGKTKWALYSLLKKIF